MDPKLWIALATMLVVSSCAVTPSEDLEIGDGCEADVDCAAGLYCRPNRLACDNDAVAPLVCTAAREGDICFDNDVGLCPPYESACDDDLVCRASSDGSEYFLGRCATAAAEGEVCLSTELRFLVAMASLASPQTPTTN